MYVRMHVQCMYECVHVCIYVYDFCTNAGVYVWYVYVSMYTCACECLYTSMTHINTT